MIKEYINSLNIPEFDYDITDKKSRDTLLGLILNEEYGFLPAAPDILKWETAEREDNFCAGKAVYKKIIMTVGFGEKTHSFPFVSVIPKSDKKVPFFVFANFRSGVPDIYYPAEEIADRGYGVLSFFYQDVTKDDNNFNDGIAGIVYPNGRKNKNDGGKISLWAWTMSRILDYAQTVPELDIKKASAIGHSRLGKAALLAGACDERFYCTISNNSGCSGAAVTRGKRGETIKDIYNKFPHWFCGNYEKYIGNENNLPFEQNMLLSLIAPRLLYVSSAAGDIWADPQAEYASCVLAGIDYEKAGTDGFKASNKFPEPDEFFHSGKIGYHIRTGTHYLSRYDWNMFIDFLDTHRAKFDL